MKQALPRFFFLRAALPVGMLAVAAVALVVMSRAKPAPVPLPTAELAYGFPKRKRR